VQNILTGINFGPNSVFWIFLRVIGYQLSVFDHIGRIGQVSSLKSQVSSLKFPSPITHHPLTISHHPSPITCRVIDLYGRISYNMANGILLRLYLLTDTKENSHGSCYF
jgi:hypothetical protein